MRDGEDTSNKVGERGWERRAYENQWQDLGTVCLNNGNSHVGMGGGGKEGRKTEKALGKSRRKGKKAPRPVLNQFKILRV